MDKLKIEVLNDKKKEILKQLINVEFNAKLNKNSFSLNNKTIETLKQQLKIIDELIDEERKNIEK
mgnify:CR=1 FL=1